MTRVIFSHTRTDHVVDFVSLSCSSELHIDRFTLHLISGGHIPAVQDDIYFAAYSQYFKTFWGFSFSVPVIMQHQQLTVGLFSVQWVHCYNLSSELNNVYYLGFLL